MIEFNKYVDLVEAKTSIITKGNLPDDSKIIDVIEHDCNKLIEAMFCIIGIETLNSYLKKRQNRRKRH